MACICLVCGIGFETLEALTNHSIIHSRESPVPDSTMLSPPDPEERIGCINVQSSDSEDECAIVAQQTGFNESPSDVTSAYAMALVENSQYVMESIREAFQVNGELLQNGQACTSDDNGLDMNECDPSLNMIMHEQSGIITPPSECTEPCPIHDYDHHNANIEHEDFSDECDMNRRWPILQLERAVECIFCKRYFPSQIELKKHTEQFHEAESDNEDVIMMGDDSGRRSFPTFKRAGYRRRRYKCFKCGQTFLRQCNLIFHSQRGQCHPTRIQGPTGHGLNTFQCQFCSKMYATQTALMRHIKMFHSRPSTDYISPRMRSQKYSCNMCDLFFYSESDVQFHFTKHPRSMPFYCQFCGKSFRSENSLFYHKKTHKTTKKMGIHKIRKIRHLKFGKMNHIQREWSLRKRNEQVNYSEKEEDPIELVESETESTSKQEESALELSDDSDTKSAQPESPLSLPEFGWKNVLSLLTDIDLEQCTECIKKMRKLLHHVRTEHSPDRPLKSKPHEARTRKKTKRPKKTVCRLCNENFRSEKFLEEHLEKHKDAVPRRSSGTRTRHFMLKCWVCFAILSNQDTLQHHFRKHPGKRPFTYTYK